MGKKLIAKGQATIVSQKDAYTINQSIGEFVFSANSNGIVTDVTSFVSTVAVAMGDSIVTNFTIGAITKPIGFSAITVNNTSKTITYLVAANTSTLSDNGVIIIPVIIAGVTYNLSFKWSKAKSGTPGIDATMLDWVADWNTGKTVIDFQSVITPKIFAGTKNNDGTITGIAIGQFSLSTRNASGTITKENINGIYGFKDGYKTFAIDTTGNVQLGYGNEYIKYNAVTGKVEFGSAVSLQWKGATYIDANGIFTGTLSADTVNAIYINASQITVGTINAARIDTASLKTMLITAGNIEALTLNVTKGKIGGWSLDSDSIFKGTKNNTSGAYTASSGSITIGSNGIRGFKWKFDATGAGAVAGGNIAWDAAGNVTFGDSVVLNWTTPINSITTALGGSSYPKLTQISATGIYTGTITATQINAGTISADRIATGSITASKLNAVSIKSDIINVGYINGLSCSFTKGTIGGWVIASGSVSSSHIILDNLNRRIAVYGAASSSTTGQRVQLYYNSDSDYGLFATDASGICIVSLGSANRIAGWIINTSQIYKNNVSLGADGSIVNGTKWKLNNDGSGQIASGNISWNASGVITFSSSVSLNWTNAATNALNSAKSYADTKKVEAINSAASDATTKAEAAKELASAMAFGKMLNRDPTFFKGDNGTNTYNNSQNGTVIITREQDNNAPNDSKYVLHIKNVGVASPHCGGFYFGTNTSFRKVFITRIIAKIPVGREITYHSNSIGIGGIQKWLTPTLGTGDWCEYICKVKCGTATFSTTNFYALTGTSGSESTPVDWYLSYATVFDVTSTERYPTTIDGNGIYTANLSANQITAGTLSADRIAAGSINASKLDATSIKANIINTDYIDGLSCTFVRGKIGGWVIGTYDITAGTIGRVGAMPMQVRSAASGSGYWYTGEYRPFGVSMTWHQSSNAGHIVFGQIASAGNSVKTGFMGIQMMAWDNTEYFCLSANYTRSDSKEVYNRIAGWAFDNTRIWKNSVSLGADGSIANGVKWQLNNDGSGRLASGNIVWDAVGHITFSSSVSLLWTNAANKGKLFARGTGLNHNANRLVYLNGNQIVSSSIRGMTLTVIRRNDLTVTSNVNYDVYESDTVCNSLASALNSLSSDYIIVLTSNDAISINTTLNTAIQRCGGSDLTIYQKRTPYVLIGIPTIGKDNGLVAVYGESQTEPYAEISTVIFNETPQGMNIYGKQKTYIDGNGIYTGMLHANQINAGTISADRIAAGSINSSKLDATSIRANIINTGYINGLSCTFDKGTIGGWYINSYQIYKNSVALSSDGSIINGSRWRLNNDGSGQLANGNIYWDAIGNVTARGAVFNNVRIQGSVRNPFVLNDSSIWIGGDTSNQQNFNNYDNIVAVRGSWDENIDLPWTLTNSGRRVTLVNYKWGSNTTVGYMTIYAPSGKYFFEDGIQKTSITFSREMVELLGYGDNSTFFGWIVINRRDVMCSSKYGSFLPCLASGIVTLSGTSVSLKQKTFDGTRISVSRTGTGRYTVYLPWNLSSNYFVQMTGYYTGTPIYATIMGIYSSYFYVQTQDDASANEGSFCFQVFSTADWS